MVLFVYGSLLPGEQHEGQLAGARALGEARTEATYTLVDLGTYPALLEGGTTAIVGELYEVDEGTLRRLDAFEGHPDEYRRAPVRLAGGARAEAYFFPRSQAADRPLVAGGDWRRR
jgi:gamma-glutamylcyclotransferase (GGCT)/AIG2-like uncharacterized protein YtfP